MLVASLHVFPRFSAGYVFPALGTGYTSRALPLVTSFPALCYVFSRAWYRLHIPRVTWSHGTVVFVQPVWPISKTFWNKSWERFHNVCNTSRMTQLKPMLHTFSNSLLAWQLRLLKNILSASAFMSRIVTVTEAFSSIRLLNEVQKRAVIKDYWRIFNRVMFTWRWTGVRNLKITSIYNQD